MTGSGSVSFAEKGLKMRRIMSCVVVLVLLPALGGVVRGQDVKPEVLRDFCKEAGLAQWKIPKEFYFQKELPHSPTGKVLKRVLMEQVNQGM